MSSGTLLIGISARIHYPLQPVHDLGGVYTKTLHFLEQSVAHWVMSRDVLALMIPPIEREGRIERTDMSLHAYAAQLDGLVLQGGNDLAPESYDETPLKPEWAGDAVRDRYEMQLVKAFIDFGKPIIGICRGHQLLNVFLGGTLYQDIPTQLPESIAHRDLDHYEKKIPRHAAGTGHAPGAAVPGQVTGGGEFDPSPGGQGPGARADRRGTLGARWSGRGAALDGTELCLRHAVAPRVHGAIEPA
jgi:putative glutamine amidotransferase